MELSKNKKIIYLIFFIIFVLLLSYKIPTFARFKNRNLSYSNVWNGSVASRYKSGNGSFDDPYIISNGEEFAYFSSQLENNNYEGVYFKLSNDILLNEGSFKYEDGFIKYSINGNVYYVNDDEYYDNSDFSGDSVGHINIFPSLSNFKGILDGDYHTVYGFYNSNSLFNNLNGEVTSLYVENAFIDGSGNLGVLANKIDGGSVSNVLVDGYIISDDFNSVVSNMSDTLSDYESLEYSVLGGLTAYSNDSTFINCVSKVNISGGFLSGGIVGYSNDSSIVNSYYTGGADSYSSNGIGVIKGSSVIDNVYSTGVINSGFIGYFIDSDVSVSNSFIATDNDFVLDVVNSNISSSNNYYAFAGRGNGINSSLASVSDLKNKNFLSSYHEFVSFDDLDSNMLNTWVFEDDLYPVLFIDDVINSYSELHLNSYMWNSYSPNLDTVNINTTITFMINDVDSIHVSDKYYYVSNSRNVLSKSDLANVSWVPYNDIVRINDEGFYIIYVKVVDNNGNVSYINSDLLVLDNSGSDIEISAFDSQWSGLNSGEVFIDHPFDFSVSASDSLSGVKMVQYYLSNSIVSDMDSIIWSDYSDLISVNDAGEYVLYVKVTDGCDFVTYASTPVIIYDGYVISNFKPLGGSGNKITSNSSISFDVSYSNNRGLNITHNLVSSFLLPLNTNITMIDRSHNKVYGYVLNSNDNFGFDVNGYASYPLSLFKEKGKVSDVYYSDSLSSNESYSFIIDFSNTNIDEDLDDVSIYLEGIGNGSLLRPTINKELFGISSSNNSRLSHTVSTSYSGSINYNSDSQTDIPISSLISYSSYFDTSYFDKKIGLAIKMVDGTGRVISKDKLKNLMFKVDDVVYLPSNDNVIRVNLNTNSSVSNVLSIITHQGSTSLKEGTYYLSISPYSSYDGMFFNNVLSSSISIPVIVSSDNAIYDYSFDVLMDSQNRIINKGGIVNLEFRILEDKLDNPNIKVSMYKKDQLTAYNQDYSLIDMSLYTNDSLDRYIDGVYYVSRNATAYGVNNEYNSFNYSLNTANLDKTSYKFVFDLYDGNNKVGSISKYIIVR